MLKKWLHRLIDRLVSGSLLRTSVLERLDNLKKQQDEAFLPWLHNMQKDLDGTVHPWLDCLKKQQDDSFLPWLHNLQHSLNETQSRLNDLNCLISELREDFIIKKIQDGKTICSNISYRSFEDKMRGDISLIRERLNLYESVIKKVIKNNGDERVYALDLGCGRGEFIDLLSQAYKVEVMGVDIDQGMIKACHEKQLNAVQCDILDYLKNQESNSVDLISMIQVAEHMPIKNLFEVMKEIRRVLRDGGACIIETPNPENLIVGACNFYLDPSHINILPPGLLDYLAKCVGFDETEVVRMHWYNVVPTEHLDSKDKIQASIKQTAHFLNNFGDYAVIGYLSK